MIGSDAVVSDGGRETEMPVPPQATEAVCASPARTLMISDPRRFTTELVTPKRHHEPLRSVTSIGSTSMYCEFPDCSWTEDASARDHFYSILTSMYALVAIVFAVVIELSQKFTPEEWLAETMFYTYMYGAGLAFLAYCYLFMIHPAWFNCLVRYGGKRGWVANYKKRLIVKSSHTGEGAGSLYLRLGTLFFGSIGIVLFGLEIFMCLSSYHYYHYQIVNLCFGGLFTFVQMHFLFCNSKLTIAGSKNLAKVGTMHLLAVNLWTWLRFVLAKHTAKSAKSNANDNTTAILISADSMLQNNNLTVSIETAAMAALGRISSFTYFGDFATLLTTCIVEYSVIGAAIMFVMWRSIDPSAQGKGVRSRKKSKVRIDCSSSSGGLFAGVLFLIASFVSIGIYSYFWQTNNSEGALVVFRVSDCALFCLALIGCCFGLYRMRLLQYTPVHSSNTEFLDELLLFIGLLGELVHCSTGLICWVSTQRDGNRMETYMLFVLLTRGVQVLIQALFILLASRLRALSPEVANEKPGKQYVTFLLIANVSLFFFHTLEGMKSVFGETVTNQRTKPFTLLISAVAPLTVFYRFHSSVCLAEIWKHCYNVKKHRSGSHPSLGSSTDSSDDCTPTERTSPVSSIVSTLPLALPRRRPADLAFA